MQATGKQQESTVGRWSSSQNQVLQHPCNAADGLEKTLSYQGGWRPAPVIRNDGVGGSSPFTGTTKVVKSLEKRPSVQAAFFYARFVELLWNQLEGVTRQC